MKKVVFSYLILFCFATYGQNKISFTEITNTKIDLSASFKSYKILKIIENLNKIGDGEKLTLSFERDYIFELKESRLSSDDYEAIIKNKNSIERKKLDELGFDGKYFLNADRTRNHQLAFSLFENQYSFYVKSLGKEFYLEPLRKYDITAAIDDYVYYEVKDIVSNTLPGCGNNDSIPDLYQQKNQMIQQDLNCKTVELNFCVDYSLYAVYYSINATINRTFEILNLTQLDYTIANDLAYDVNFKLNRHYILTCPDCNYWPSSNSVQTNHSYFLNYSNYSQIFDIKSDCNVFWLKYNSSESGAFGYGALNSLNYCNPAGINTRGCVTFAISPDTNQARATLAHELGHNFGCYHINESDNIMSGYGSTGHFWHPSSVNVINNTLTSSNCFTDCQTELCDNRKVENLTVTVDSSNSLVNVNWLSEEGMEYNVRLYTFNTNVWTTYTTVSYPQNSIVLPYTNTVACGNRYKVEIVPVCSGINGFSQLVVLATNTAATYPGVSYLPGDSICSGHPYTFTEHVIYPGNNPIYQWTVNGLPVGTNSPILTISTLQNNDVLRFTVISNDPCVVNQTGAAEVWVSVVTSGSACTSLSDTEFDLQYVTYFPNPVKNSFTIKSKAIIKNISIFNLLGQRLFQNSISDTESILDLSLFPNATYLVKIEFDHFTKTIKIVKE